MRSIGWLLLGTVALAAHEYVVSSHRFRKLFARPLRWALLLTALTSTLMAGPSIRSRVLGIIASHDEVPAQAYVSGGDTAFTLALSGQRPEYPFPSGLALPAVQAWRVRVLQALSDRAGLTGDVPSNVPWRVLHSENLGTIRRTLVVFSSWDGTSIPAYVHEQEGGTRRPAVLVVAGHGLGIAAAAGLVEDYQHSAALELARRGYVTLTPELRGFGMLGVDGRPNHRSVSAAALEAGTSYKAIAARDLAWALTVLQNWPAVDSGRLGVAGTSLGGELAVLLGVLDPRVRVVLSHSYGGAIGPATVEHDVPDDAQQTSHGCHTIPGANRIVRQEDWARLVAPRPLLVVRGDRNTPTTSDAFGVAVRESYTAYGASDRFVLSVELGAHEFYLEPSVRFLARWL